MCRVKPMGRLTDCAITTERPSGYGLGAWLVQLLSHASVGPTAKDGSPTAGRMFAFTTQVRTGPASADAPPKS